MLYSLANIYLDNVSVVGFKQNIDFTRFISSNRVIEFRNLKIKCEVKIEFSCSPHRGYESILQVKKLLQYNMSMWPRRCVNKN